MKNLKKLLSIALAVVMAVSIVPLGSFIAPIEASAASSATYDKEYYYPAGTQLVTDVAVGARVYGSLASGRENAAKGYLTDKGYTLLGVDVNAGCSKSNNKYYYTHLGYMKSSDEKNAIRAVAFYNSPGDAPSSINYTINGHSCTFYPVLTSFVDSSNSTGAVFDLNKGVGGDTIYMYYTKDPNAGPPITAFDYDENSTNDSGNICQTPAVWLNTNSKATAGNVADLNAGAGGDYVYVFYNQTGTEVDTSALHAAITNGESYLANASQYISVANLQTAVNNAKAIVNDYNADGLSCNYDQTAINNAKTAIENAINNLQMLVLFDNLFDYRLYKDSFADSTIRVDEVTDTGFTVTGLANADGSHYNDCKSAWTYNIPIKPNTTYVVYSDIEHTAAGSYGYEIFAMVKNSSGAQVSGGTCIENCQPEGAYISAKSKNAFTFTTSSTAAYMSLRFDPNDTGSVMTVNNIRVYEAGTVESGVSYHLSQTVSVTSPYYGTLPTPTKEGYVFEGWVNALGNKVTASNPYNYQYGKVLYSTWSPFKYTVNLNGNGAENYKNQSFTVSYNEEIELPPLTKQYNTLLGWYTNADGTGTRYEPGTKVKNLTTTSGDVINLFAIWERNDYTVNFYDGDKLLDTQTYICGVDYNLPQGKDIASEHEGQHILGWNTKADGTGTAYAPGETVTDLVGRKGTINLYVDWEADYYAIIFDGNGATGGSTANITVKYGEESAVLPENGFTKEGYTFVCWEDMYGTWWNPNEDPIEKLDKSNGKTYTMWAHWVADTHTVTFVDDNGTVLKTEIVANGKAATAPTVPEKALTEGVCSYEFTGWDKAFSNVTVDNLVVTAQYKITAHKPGKTVAINGTSANCTQGGSYDEVVYCKVCDKPIGEPKHVTVEALGHTSGPAKVENDKRSTSCAVDGSYDLVYYCTVCGEEISRTTYTEPATGHVPGKPVIENADIAICTKSGSYDEVVYCTVCKNQISTKHVKLDAPGHVEVIDEAVEATCITTGLTEGKHCAVCGTVLVAQTEVPVTGHKEEILPAVTASCTTEGLTEGKKCSVCGDVLVEQVASPKQDHTKAEIPAVAATCSATGLTAGVKCSVCGEVLTEPEVIDKLAHTVVIDAAVAPTCTTTGLTAGKHCSVCEEVLEAQKEVPALNHTPGEAVKEKEKLASCSEDGSYDEVVYCTVCKVELSRETVTVKATGEHNYATEKDKKEATCTENGYVIMACACGATNKTTLDKTGHNYVFAEQVDATCSKEGKAAHYKCQNCKKVFNDDAAKTATTEAKLIIAKPDHLPDAAAVTEKAATCTESGSRDTIIKCTVCEGVISHTIVTIPALGHDWDEGIETTGATCGQKGEMTYTCQRDGATKTEAIAKVPHTRSEAVVENEKAATATKDGSLESVVYCSVCKAEISRTTMVIPATGNGSSDSDGSGNSSSANLSFWQRLINWINSIIDAIKQAFGG